MSTLAAALASQARRPSVRCAVAVLLDSLDDIDKKALEKAFADPNMEASRIFRALAAEGHKNVGMSSIGRHRRGDCRCDAR